MGVLLQVLLSFMRIGVLSFGGAYAAVPLVEREVVLTRGWLSATEFANLLAIDELTPGPILINSATFVGMRVAGVPGAVIATLDCIHRFDAAHDGHADGRGRRRAGQRVFGGCDRGSILPAQPAARGPASGPSGLRRPWGRGIDAVTVARGQSECVRHTESVLSGPCGGCSATQNHAGRLASSRATQPRR